MQEFEFVGADGVTQTCLYDCEQATFEKVWRFRTSALRSGQVFELILAEASPSTVDIVSMTQDSESARILRALLPVISMRLRRYVTIRGGDGIDRITLPIVSPPGPPPEWMKYLRMVPVISPYYRKS